MFRRVSTVALARWGSYRVFVSRWSSDGIDRTRQRFDQLHAIDRPRLIRPRRDGRRLGDPLRARADRALAGRFAALLSWPAASPRWVRQYIRPPRWPCADHSANAAT